MRENEVAHPVNLSVIHQTILRTPSAKILPARLSTAVLRHDTSQGHGVGDHCLAPSASASVPNGRKDPRQRAAGCAHILDQQPPPGTATLWAHQITTRRPPGGPANWARWRADRVSPRIWIIRSQTARVRRGRARTSTATEAQTRPTSNPAPTRCDRALAAPSPVCEAPVAAHGAQSPEERSLFRSFSTIQHLINEAPHLTPRTGGSDMNEPQSTSIATEVASSSECGSASAFDAGVQESSAERKCVFRNGPGVSNSRTLGNLRTHQGMG